MTRINPKFAGRSREAAAPQVVHCGVTYSSSTTKCIKCGEDLREMQRQAKQSS